MKSKSLPVMMLLVAFLSSGIASAHGGGWFGGHSGGGFRGGWRVSGGWHGGGWHDGGWRWGGGRLYGWGYPAFGFYGGSSLFWPYFYDWPYYSYPFYFSIPASPPVYIEQGASSQANPQGSNAWQYCQDPEGYYPHVKECPGGWSQVEPQPVGQEPGYWYYCSDPRGYYPYVKECSAPWRKIVP